MTVFVLDKNKKPLMPTTQKRARKLLNKKEAVIHKYYPFTIRLKHRKLENSKIQDITAKLHPGSKISGSSLVRMPTENTPNNKETAIAFYEIMHKLTIKDTLRKRSNRRRLRRTRKLRYRKPRFLNRKKSDSKCKVCNNNKPSDKSLCRPCSKESKFSQVKKEKIWLPPSIQAKVDQNVNFIIKISKLCPLSKIAVNRAKFDTQLMENPDIKGVEYQRGTLYGYEIKEYLLEKWIRKCSFCKGKNKSLMVGHIKPVSRGGTNRVSNLCLICQDCNEKKGNKTAKEFGYPNIQSRAKKPLKDAASLNSNRNKIYIMLKKKFPNVEKSTCGLTKKNRCEMKLPKEKYIEAACVGETGNLVIKAKTVNIFRYIGRGYRQRTQVDKYGTPRNQLQRKKIYFGFQTGCFVKVTKQVKDKKTGKKYTQTKFGRITVRASGLFYINNIAGKRYSCSHRMCKKLQNPDGWNYDKKKITSGGKKKM